MSVFIKLIQINVETAEPFDPNICKTLFIVSRLVKVFKKGYSPRFTVNYQCQISRHAYLFIYLFKRKTSFLTLICCK